MPRTPRKYSQTDIYHVVIKSVNHEMIFKYGWQKKALLDLLAKKCKEKKVEIYCYCVMTTHAHFLMKGNLKGISESIKDTSSMYAMGYNQHEKRNGHLFQGRFYSGGIENERAYWNCVNYIHNNPVKAAMVKSPDKFVYSSYHEYATQKSSRISEKAIRYMKLTFHDAEEFKKFSVKNKQSTWFYGTEEEIAQQKNELIQELLERYMEPSQVFSTKKSILKCEYVDKIAEELNITKKEVYDFMIQRFLCNKMGTEV